MKTRVIQEQPFCWQSKVARRLIRSSLPRIQAQGTLAVYDGLTELASDARTESGEWTRQQIADTACVSLTTVIKAMRELSRLKLVLETKRRDAAGHVLTPTIQLLNPDSIFGIRVEGAPQDVVVSKPELHNPDSKSLIQGFGAQELKNPFQPKTKSGADAPPPAEAPQPSNTKMLKRTQGGPPTDALAEWFPAWAKQYPGLAYPWTGYDSKCWKEIKAAVPDEALRAAIIRVYTRRWDRDSFEVQQKHPLRGIRARLPQLQAEAASNLKRAARELAAQDQVKNEPPAAFFTGPADEPPSNLADLIPKFESLTPLRTQ